MDWRLTCWTFLIRLCEKVTTRALRLASFPSKSQTRALISMEEAPLRCATPCDGNERTETSKIIETKRKKLSECLVCTAMECVASIKHKAIEPVVIDPRQRDETTWLVGRSRDNSYLSLSDERGSHEGSSLCDGHNDEEE